MSDVVAITGILAASVVVLVGVFVFGGVLRRHYDAKIANSKRMAALRNPSQRRESAEEAEERPAGLDLDALGGVDGAMDAIGIPAAVRPAIEGFLNSSGGIDGILGKLKKATVKGGGEWNF